MAVLTDFEASVFKLVAKIPQGKVTTYQALACALGKPRAIRAAGNALGKNPNLIKVPCHRVVRSDGKVGGYAGGAITKVKLLKAEGVQVVRNGIMNFEKIFYNFK